MAKAGGLESLLEAGRREEPGPNGRDWNIRLQRKIELASQIALDKKAGDPIVLDLKGTCSFADAFLICHGLQVRQNQAIADAILAGLKKQKVSPTHVEGYRNGEWILMDYSDLIIHIFSRERREFFSLERLWGDAPRRDVTEKSKKKRSSGSGGG